MSVCVGSGFACADDEFVEEYGGEDEWHRAKPLRPHRAPLAKGGKKPPQKAAQKPAPKQAPKPTPSAPLAASKASTPLAAGDELRSPFQPSDRQTTGTLPPGLSVGGSAVATDAAAASAATITLPPPPPPPPSKQLNMVVIGHVDSGKSTLMGRLLLHAGKVDARTMHKYTQESQQLGKGSFRFAWVMDQSEEERERGVTVEVGTAFFSSGTRAVNVLDAPGHRDFVPNMIGGAAQADLALLVVNASNGEFESGLSGQTREHIVLAKSLGVQRLLVAVNQMDCAQWSEERYDQIRLALAPLLEQAGYRSPPPAFIPLSALEGANIARDTRPTSGLEWYQGLSLLEEIDNVVPLHRSSTVGTRLAISDAFRHTATSALGALALTGTLQAGTLEVGQRLLLLPAQETVVVRSLQSRGEAVTEATAGDHVEARLAAASSSFDPSSVGIGSVLCDPLRPVALATRVEVQLKALGMLLTKGQPFELHSNAGGEVACTLRKFIASVDRRTGLQLNDAKAPRCLAPGGIAVVYLQLESPMPLERHSDCRQLGRIVLRQAGETVAAGLVTAIVRSTASARQKHKGRGSAQELPTVR
jgi:elongation factor 1 alpha-like protein